MADLLCKTAKIVVLAMSSRVAYPLLLRELGGLHGKHPRQSSPEISFYFIFYCRPFFYLARLERSTVKNGTKKRKVDPPFTRRYRFTWRQNEKEDVAPLFVAFGRLNLGRMRNDSRHRGRSTGPRESVKKGGFGDGRGGFGSTIGLRRAISLL
jgi:hypothetical protein